MLRLDGGLWTLQRGKWCREPSLGPPVTHRQDGPRKATIDTVPSTKDSVCAKAGSMWSKMISKNDNRAKRGLKPNENAEQRYRHLYLALGGTLPLEH